MLTEMFDALDKGGVAASSIDDAIAAHLIAFAAEESRLRGGENINMAEFEKTINAG